MKLNLRQKSALRQFKTLGYHSAYDLKVGMPTLNALMRRGLLERTYSVGQLFFPRLHTLYKLTEAGRNV